MAFLLPLARLIEQKLKQPLADELLFGRLRNTGEVKVELSENKVFLDVACGVFVAFLGLLVF